MHGKQHRSPAGDVVGDEAAEALPEALIAAAEPLVDEEQVGVEAGVDREAEPAPHPGAVGADRGVELLVKVGEGRNRLRLGHGVGDRHAVQGQLHADVLPAGLLRAENSPLIDAADFVGMQRDRAGGGEDDPRHEVHQRALAGAVVTDDADHLTGIDPQVDVLERPKLSVAEPLPGRQPAELAKRVGGGVAETGLGPERVALRNLLHVEEGSCHGATPASVRRRAGGRSGRETSPP